MIVTDNATVVAYINRLGGTRSSKLRDLTRQLYLLADSIPVHISARYIPGKYNVLADLLSRPNNIVSTEWTLHPSAFRLIQDTWERPQIDLFATCLNHQLLAYVNPIPDLHVYAVDALSIAWTGMVAFSPIAIIPQVLMKCRIMEMTLYLVAPAWPTKTWFPDLMTLLVDRPLKLPVWTTLLCQPRSDRFHRNPSALHLHVWKLSNNTWLQQGFQRKYPKLFQDPSENLQLFSTIISGSDSSSGESDLD